jgi:magnesium chelatase accessory protein
MTRRDVPQGWPFRQDARTLRVGLVDWYLIDIGPKDAAAIWLLHGLGASGHSFRQMIGPLAERFRVIVPDLPGQGYSRAADGRRFGLDPMAEDLAALSVALQVTLDAAIGHSAGAALALRLSELTDVKAVVGINAALGTFDGAAGLLFPLLAKGLAVAPFAASLFARLSGNMRTVEKLLTGTGSPLDAAGREMYVQLVRDPAHVAGALGMMAQWRLEPLMERLTWLSVPTLLLTGDRDNAVPPAVSDQAAAKMRKAEVRHLPNFGHLAHEEARDGLADVILPWLQPLLQPAMAESPPKIIGR